MTTPILAASGLTKRFGGLTAVDNIEIAVAPTSVMGVIGPNGAGKTTLLNLLSGALRPDEGKIHLNDVDLTELDAAGRARAGMRRTFQNIRLFSTVTVLENVMVGMHTQTRGWVFGGIVRTPAIRRSEREALDKAHDVMVRLGIETRAQTVAGSLSYGDQRRVEMARALVSQPDVLLLDEPAAGLNSAEKEAAGQLIASLPAEFDLSVVLVEHDMGLVSATCSHVLVMDYGQHLCDGAPATVLNDQRVVDAYLGTEAVQL